MARGPSIARLIELGQQTDTARNVVTGHVHSGIDSAWRYMVWIRIDDQIAHHPKFTKAGPIASWLWVCGNGYCNKYLTDGFIPDSALDTIGCVTNPRKWAERLEEVGLWDRDEARAGYVVHDFHDYNPTAAQVRSKRKVRAEAGKLGAEVRWGADGKRDGKSHR